MGTASEEVGFAASAARRGLTRASICGRRSIRLGSERSPAKPSDAGRGVVGAAVAILLSLIKKIPIVLVVIGAVLADMALYYFI